MGLYRRRSDGRESGRLGGEELNMAAAPDKSVAEQPAPAARGDASRTDLRISRRPVRTRRYEPTLIGGGSVLLFLIVWQAAASARVVPPLFLPGPLDIVDAFVVLFAQGQIWNDIWVSGQELVYGYGLAVLIGLPLGLLMGWYRRLNYALDPFINFFYSTPRVALLPLLILWFGIGIWSKIAVVFLGSFFPIVINTIAGVRNLDAGLIKTSRSFGATDAQIFRTLALPGSVPFILAGLRLAVGHALIGMVVGELVAAQAGVGLMMAKAGATFQTSKVFAGLIIVAGTGIITTGILQRIEHRFQAWKPQNNT
jgi:ABC-type nitrate/sulfonate/bicarbonate transport system permease component